MSDRIDYDALTGMLSAVVVRIREARDALAALDAATGDGDHGVAMGKVADAIERCVQNAEHGSVHLLLSEIGWAAMGTDAGSSGPLYGSLFLGMSEGSVGVEDVSTAGLAALLEQGVVKLRTCTQADRGDKTMIDALLPAVDAVRSAAEQGQTIAEALASAAAAAEAGAAGTADMQAAFGRAKNIGERSIGHVDPGAASMSLVFAGLKEGLTNG